MAGAIAAILMVALAVAGCSLTANNDDSDDAADAGPGEPIPAPKATVEITYHKSGDTLSRATVTKFFGAEIIANAAGSGGRVASVVRFDGGVPIWEINTDRGITDEISGFGKSDYAPKTLSTGNCRLALLSRCFQKKARRSRSTAAPIIFSRSSELRARSAIRR